MLTQPVAAEASIVPTETCDISKSARKRAALRAQKVGLALTALREPELARIPMSDALREAISLYVGMTKRGARRRQLQYIGRLMRDEDHTAIERALEEGRGNSTDVKRRERDAAMWRDRLTGEPDDLTAFVEEYPDVDVRALREALRAYAAASEDARPRVSTKILQLVREPMTPR